MRIAITAGLGARSETTIDGLADAPGAGARGFAGMWLPNAFGFDAITALARRARHDSHRDRHGRRPHLPAPPGGHGAAGATARRLEGASRSASASPQGDDGGPAGIPYEKPARHMREYLRCSRRSCAANRPRSKASSTARRPPSRSPAPPGPAARRGARRCHAAARRDVADGTITSWVGPKTLATHIVPGISAAAAKAGEPAPRVAVGLPIALTDDAAAARATLAERAAWYNSLPSYRAMLDIEGVANPADIAIVGDEAALDAGLAALREAGATDFLAQLISVGPGSPERTLEYLASRATQPSDSPLARISVCRWPAVDRIRDHGDASRPGHTGARRYGHRFKIEPPYHLILLDDDYHTYQYVIAMCTPSSGIRPTRGSRSPASSICRARRS